VILPNIAGFPQFNEYSGFLQKIHVIDEVGKPYVVSESDPIMPNIKKGHKLTFSMNDSMTPLYLEVYSTR
jgi:hypothetical protein